MLEFVQPALPHDDMGVVKLNGSGDRFKLQAGAGLQKAVLFDVPVADREMAHEFCAGSVVIRPVDRLSGAVRDMQVRTRTGFFDQTRHPVHGVCAQNNEIRPALFRVQAANPAAGIHHNQRVTPVTSRSEQIG